MGVVALLAIDRSAARWFQTQEAVRTRIGCRSVLDGTIELGRRVLCLCHRFALCSELSGTSTDWVEDPGSFDYGPTYEFGPELLCHNLAVAKINLNAKLWRLAELQCYAEPTRR